MKDLELRSILYRLEKVFTRDGLFKMRPIIKVWVRARVKKRTQTFWEKELRNLISEPPRRAYFPRRLWGENGFWGVIMIRAGADFPALTRQPLWTC